MPKTLAPRLVSWPTSVPKPLSCPPLTDAPSDGANVIAWIERFCVFGEGDRYGEPVTLELFEKLLLLWLFELRSDGSRRYKRAYFEMPRGNAKTAILAWVMLYLLCTQKSPEIMIIANSYDQADIPFRFLKTCVLESPRLSALLEVFEGVVQPRRGPGRGCFKLPSSESVIHGYGPTAAGIDELHEFSREREGVHNAITTGTHKRPGTLVVNVSTPGWDKNSIAGKMHDRGVKVNRGELTDDRFLFVQFGCPADRYDLDTEAGLMACIADANPAPWLDREDIAAKYGELQENDWLRYHAGLWVPARYAWLPGGSWDGCADPGRVIEPGAEVIVGFDGSSTNDATAVVVVSCEAVPHIYPLQVWEKPEGPEGEGWRVAREEVMQAIRWAAQHWKVRELVADPSWWRSELQQLESEGMTVVEFPQNTAHWSPAIRRFYSAVVEQTLTHSGDPDLARHVANTHVHNTPRGQLIRKATEWSPNKIDLCAAAVMAFDRASQIDLNDYDLMESVM
jgi:phage terminase large subunit-like protein